MVAHLTMALSIKKERYATLVIVMQKKATEAQIDHVIRWIESIGNGAHPSGGVEQTIEGLER
jgi:hypothetical protein